MVTFQPPAGPIEFRNAIQTCEPFGFHESAGKAGEAGIGNGRWEIPPFSIGATASQSDSVAPSQTSLPANLGTNSPADVATSCRHPEPDARLNLGGRTGHGPAHRDDGESDAVAPSRTQSGQIRTIGFQGGPRPIPRKRAFTFPVRPGRTQSNQFLDHGTPCDDPKFQIANLKSQNWRWFPLKFGFWSLPGGWCLEFGASASGGRSAQLKFRRRPRFRVT
jgi:hypothetical protein